MPSTDRPKPATPSSDFDVFAYPSACLEIASAFFVLEYFFYRVDIGLMKGMGPANQPPHVLGLVHGPMSMIGLFTVPMFLMFLIPGLWGWGRYAWARLSGRNRTRPEGTPWRGLGIMAAAVILGSFINGSSVSQPYGEGVKDLFVPIVTAVHQSPEQNELVFAQADLKAAEATLESFSIVQADHGSRIEALFTMDTCQQLVRWMARYPALAKTLVIHANQTRVDPDHPERVQCIRYKYRGYLNTQYYPIPVTFEAP